MEVYNHMTSSIGKAICFKGWKKSGIQEILESNLEDNLDSFNNIDPIERANEASNDLFMINKMCINQQNLDDDDSDWEDRDDNIFDVFIEDDEGDD